MNIEPICNAKNVSKIVFNPLRSPMTCTFNVKKEFLELDENSICSELYLKVHKREYSTHNLNQIKGVHKKT